MSRKEINELVVAEGIIEIERSDDLSAPPPATSTLANERMVVSPKSDRDVLSAVNIYVSRYLRRNELQVFWEGYEKLDQMLNLFFSTYAHLARTSTNCAKIWLGVMEVRTIMVNSAQHLVDNDDYLAPAFKEDRRREYSFILQPCINAVARAVQYMATFNLHARENWKFQRKKFLQELAQEINQDLVKMVSKWRAFLKQSYSLSSKFFKSFVEHLKKEKRHFHLALLQEQPKSKIAENDAQFCLVLQHMIKDLKHLKSSIKKERHGEINLLDLSYTEKSKEGKPGMDAVENEDLKLILSQSMLSLRIQVSIVEDVLDFWALIPNSMIKRASAKLDHPKHFFQSKATLKEAKSFLRQEFTQAKTRVYRDKPLHECTYLKRDHPGFKAASILKRDNLLWPHQQGLKDLGPFSLVPLEEPLKYLEYIPGDGAGLGSYHLKDELLNNNKLRLEGFQNVGKVTKLTEVTYKLEGKDLIVRENLKIPEGATHFCFFYAMLPKDDYEIIEEPDETDLEKMVSGDLLPSEHKRKSFQRSKKRKQNMFTDHVHKMTTTHPLFVLCSYGGFAYFDEQGSLLTVNGVVFGDDLFFDGPYYVHNPNFFNTLEENGVHMSDVTLGPLRAQDAIKFAWIGTGNDVTCLYKESTEKFGNSENEVFKGAFVYQYDNSKHEKWSGNNYADGARRNYFQVLDFQELELKKALNTNTPVMPHLKYHIDVMKGDWEPFHKKKAEAEKPKEKPKCLWF